MKKRSDNPNEVRSFGIIFSVLFLFLSAYSLYKGKHEWGWYIGASAFFLISGLFIQPILRPLQYGWMKFAFALGWFNTRLILGLVFYLIVTPVGLFLKLIRKDTLGLKFDLTVSSYWKIREKKAFDKKRYEQLF